MKPALLILVLIGFAAAQPSQPGLDACASALDRGDFADAARQARSWLSAHPASVDARILLARAFIGLNDGTAALDQLREALRRNPDSIDALYFASKLTAILSQQEFAAVARIAPDSARMHQIRGDIAEAHGDANAAEREYLAALEKRPGTSYVMNALGDLKRHQKLYRPALNWYERVLAKDPANYDALYGAGACYRKLQDPHRALALFRRAFQSDPSSVAAQLALGEALLHAGNTQQAIPLLESAVKSAPHLRRLWFLLARAYKAAGRNTEARAALDKTRQLPEVPADDEGDPQ